MLPLSIGRIKKLVQEFMQRAREDRADNIQDASSGVSVFSPQAVDDGDDLLEPLLIPMSANESSGNQEMVLRHDSLVDLFSVAVQAIAVASPLVVRSTNNMTKDFDRFRFSSKMQGNGFSEWVVEVILAPHLVELLNMRWRTIDNLWEAKRKH